MSSSILRFFAISVFCVSPLIAKSLDAADGRQGNDAISEVVDLFQYRVQTLNQPNKKFPEGRPVNVYLWVPEDAETIKGLLIGGSILMEPDFAVDPIIRDACSEIGLGIVYSTPHFDGLFPYQEGDSGERLIKLLEELAAVSNHPEIASAPLMPFGHSVASLYASRVFKWAPERCFAVLTYKGGLEVSPVDNLKRLSGVPVLHIHGQFEEFGSGGSGTFREHETRESGWNRARTNLINLRQKESGLLLGLLVEDGSTHMPWTGRLSHEVAEFIRSAAALRLPEKIGDPLKKVDAGEGIILDKEFNSVGGANLETLWYPSKNMADMIASRFDRQQGARTQFVTFMNGRRPQAVGHDMRMKFTNINWVDHDIFEVAGTFLDSPPKRYPTLPEGTEKAGHANGEVYFQPYGRRLEQVAPNRFRQLHNGRSVKASIIAFHPGNETFRYTEQPAVFRLRKPKGGTEQSITLITPSELSVEMAEFPLQLEAKASSKLPVRYWVDHGPVVVDAGGKLQLTQIPAKATYPLSIEVVAYQMGSHIDRVLPAEPVTLKISVTK